MRQPWIEEETRETIDGLLQLRRRGERDFVISIGGRVLMSSAHTRSEVVVAQVGCAPIAGRARPRVLVSGLGLGFTLRAALDALPPQAEVVVAELNEVVVDWCRGPASSAAGDTLSDSRVQVVVGDVTREIHRAANRKASRYDAIILDLYVGPPEPPARGEDPLYGKRIVASTHEALTAGGVLSVWGEAHSPSYGQRLRAAGFRTETVRPKGGGPRHVVHLGHKT